MIITVVKSILVFIVACTILVIINQTNYGYCYEGYCIEAAISQVWSTALFISIGYGVYTFANRNEDRITEKGETKTTSPTTKQACKDTSSGIIETDTLTVNKISSNQTISLIDHAISAAKELEEISLANNESEIISESMEGPPHSSYDFAIVVFSKLLKDQALNNYDHYILRKLKEYCDASSEDYDALNILIKQDKLLNENQKRSVITLLLKQLKRKKNQWWTTINELYFGPEFIDLDSYKYNMPCDEYDDFDYHKPSKNYNPFE